MDSQAQKKRRLSRQFISRDYYIVLTDTSAKLRAANAISLSDKVPKIRGTSQAVVEVAYKTVLPRGVDVLSGPYTHSQIMDSVVAGNLDIVTEFPTIKEIRAKAGV